jgi:tRNA-dihydrouridine synthase B
MNISAKVFKVGALKLQSSAMLSPLESVSCVGFRNICFKNGASLVWTEMIRAAALTRENASACDLIDTFDESSLTGVQLLAKSVDELTLSLEKIETLAFSSRPHYQNIRAVDLNFGCPSPDVIREGAGPALLKRRKRLSDLFNALSSWRSRTRLKIGAVGCKIRLGLNAMEQRTKVYLPVLEAACDRGLDYIVVHGRNAAQRSSDPPSHVELGEVKNRAIQLGSNIKVFGNGNISSRDDAEKLMNLTGCGWLNLSYSLFILIYC